MVRAAGVTLRGTDVGVEGSLRRFVVMVVVASLAVAATSALAVTPAGAETADVDTWAEGFCNALERWQTGATKVRDLVKGVVDDGVTSAAKAKVLRTRIASGFNTASKAAAAASDDIDGLGEPDVAGGTKIRTTLSDAIADTATVFASARTTAAGASTDPKRFESAMKTLYRQVDRGLTGVGQKIDGIEALSSGGELDTALDDEPACDFLTGS
jgi:hypothetical protein